jgi:hypothetical protein
MNEASECSCLECADGRGQGILNMRMILCQTCGNKRCPHATDHALAPSRESTRSRLN